jgi:pantoate--beta-alanine ligase
MKTVHKIADLRKELEQVRRDGTSIGFVATMGSLHAGHISLVRAALADNDYVVVSIFVNPTQFGPNEDFDTYPRSLERDQQLLQEAGANLLFAPTASEMYPNGYNTYVETFGVTDVLCGASRPGHFRGVTTVVSKLFNIVQPVCAYFGQKDAQQYAVIRRMATDLNFPIEIISCPIVREADGLALSSRNKYLTANEREQATVLYEALQLAEKLVAGGERDSAFISNRLYDTIAKCELARIEYIAIVDATTLEAVDKIVGETLVALAVHFGKTRLIDNTVIRG